jgi:hypothetical protein
MEHLHTIGRSADVGFERNSAVAVNSNVTYSRRKHCPRFNGGILAFALDMPLGTVVLNSL